MIIECTGHLVLVTTNNCNTFSILHGLEITTTTNMCYVLTLLYLVAACEDGDSACCFCPSVLAGLPLSSINTTTSSSALSSAYGASNLTSWKRRLQRL
jgi:hypothetical protein